jgi:hypothetical protein
MSPFPKCPFQNAPLRGASLLSISRIMAIFIRAVEILTRTGPKTPFYRAHQLRFSQVLSGRRFTRLTNAFSKKVGTMLMLSRYISCIIPVSVSTAPLFLRSFRTVLQYE